MRRLTAAGRFSGSAARSGSFMITAASISVVLSPVERVSAGEHLVEDDAEGPDVGALVDGLALRLLRRHVGGGADDHSHLCRARAVSVGATCGSASAGLEAG